MKQGLQQGLGIAALLGGQRAVIREIAGRHGASHVRLFGSVARGEALPDSDVDFLVAMEKGRDLLDLVGLEQELAETLGRRVDVVTDEGLSPYLKQQIESEAVPV